MKVIQKDAGEEVLLSEVPPGEVVLGCGRAGPLLVTGEKRGLMSEWTVCVALRNGSYLELMGVTRVRPVNAVVHIAAKK